MQISLRKLGWAAAALVIGLVACNITNDVRPTPIQGSTDNLDRVDVRALVLGRADGPVIESFDEEVELTSYDGSQDIAEYDLVIFDGDNFTPAAVRDQGVISQALQQNKWVLGVDLTGAHKQDGLGSFIGFASHGDSPGYLVRKGLVNSYHYVSVVDYPTEGIRNATAAQNLLAASKTRATVTLEATSAFIADTLKSIDSEAVLSSQADPTPPEAPSDLLHAKYIHTQPLIYNLDGPKKTKKGTSYPKQSARVDLTTTFHVYLDNKDNPEGNFQWVIAEIEGNANPTSGTNTFANMAKDEKAWFQDQLAFNIAPAEASDGLFAPTDSAPETENGKTTISSEVDVSIGFEGKKGTGEFGYHWGKEREISDWKVDNDTSGNKAAWNYRSGNPYDADKPYGCEASGFVGGNGFDWQCWPQDPNALSKNALQFHAQAVWKTDKVATEPVEFFSYLEHRMRDVYCTSDFGAMCLDAQHTEDLSTTQSLPLGYSIDLSSVVPVVLHFDDTRVYLNDDPTRDGKITVATPAPAGGFTVRLSLLDVDGNLSNGSATFPETITIPAGQTSAPVRITFTNGGPPDNAFGFFLHADAGDVGEHEIEFVVSRE